MSQILAIRESERHNAPVPRFLVSCAVTLLPALYFAQQIDTVDLTRPEPPITKLHDESAPPGCENLSPGVIADGWIEPTDRRARKITVRVVSGSDLNAALGSEVEAEVHLQNNDPDSIRIPWSTDPNSVMANEDASQLSWTAGTFEYDLTDAKGDEVALVSLTEWVYSSESARGSQITIQPGQTVAARVKFKIEDRFSIDKRLQPGEWRLFAKWHQVNRHVWVKDCGRNSGFYQYERFYKQENVPLTIHVAPQTTPKP